MDNMLYLDSFNRVDLDNKEDLIIINDKELDDELQLNDLHTRSGYNNHSNSGCNTHSNSGCNNCYNSTCSDHTDTGYNDHTDGTYTNHSQSGCNTHSQSGCNTHTNSGYDNVFDHEKDSCDTHSRSGCNTHSDYGYDNHSDSGYSDLVDSYNTIYSQSGCNTHSKSGCNNHSQSGCTDHYQSGYSNHGQSGYNNHTNYTNNYDPNLSGVITGDGSSSYNLNIPLTWAAASDSNTGDTIQYYLYKKYKSTTDSDFGNWDTTPITTTTSTSYNWDVSGLPPGEYIVRVRAWDGKEWNDNGTSDISSSGLDSESLIVIHYQAPSWSRVLTSSESIIKANDVHEVRNEVNKARASYGLEDSNFTDQALDGVIIKKVHRTELKQKGDELNTTAGKGSFGWKDESEIIKVDFVTDVRELLENL